MTKGRNPFNAMNDRSTEFVAKEQQEAFEDTKVRHVMDRVGLVEEKKRLLRYVRRRYEAERLTFRVFNEVFSTFPVYLSCNRLGNVEPLHKNPKAILPIWFKTFLHLPFMEAYEAAYDAWPAKDRPFGMVFPRNGFKQGLIVHNGDLHQFVPPNASCHVYLGGSDKKRRKKQHHQIMLVVQPFTAFLDHIYNRGHGWKGEFLSDHGV
jgi:hypothetical protein